MNYVLFYHHFPPVVIKSANKKDYLFALNKADSGDLDAFVEYIARQLIWSLEISIRVGKGEEIEEADDVEKEISLWKSELKKTDFRDNDPGKHPTGTRNSASYWKEKLLLTAHVEGGAFHEVYRSALSLPRHVLTPRYHGDRNAATSIYFLLEHGDFSAFHRIASDELWHFYDGDTLAIYEINIAGTLIKHQLGRNMEEGASLQVVISAGSWFASRVEVPCAFALCGCTVAPGFDFEDFELGKAADLIEKYPQHKQLIASLTRK